MKGRHVEEKKKKSFLIYRVSLSTCFHTFVAKDDCSFCNRRYSCSTITFFHLVRDGGNIRGTEIQSLIKRVVEGRAMVTMGSHPPFLCMSKTIAVSQMLCIRDRSNRKCVECVISFDNREGVVRLFLCTFLKTA